MIETGHRRLPIGTISGVSVNYRYRFRLVGRMTAYHVRRDKAALSSGCKAHPAIRSSRKRPWCVLSFEAVALLRHVTERDGSKMASRNGKWQGSRSARCSYRTLIGTVSGNGAGQISCNIAP